MLPAALLFIGSILFIGAGIFCIVQPAASLLAVGYYVGFVLVLGGVCQILRYVKTDSRYRSPWHLLIAILDTAFGLWMMMSLAFAVVAFMLPLLFAILYPSPRHIHDYPAVEEERGPAEPRALHGGSGGADSSRACPYPPSRRSGAPLYVHGRGCPHLDRYQYLPYMEETG